MSIYQRLQDIEKNQGTAAFCVIVSAKGSTPRRALGRGFFDARITHSLPASGWFGRWLPAPRTRLTGIIGPQAVDHFRLKFRGAPAISRVKEANP